jgi:hypothetical protein
MHKIGRNRLEQSPGASARQAAAMADFQALRQQQQQQHQQHQQRQQELEQMQLWSRLRDAQQAETVLARRHSGHLMTPAEVAAAVSLQAGTAGAQGLFQSCGNDAAAAMAGAAHNSNAAAAAAVAGSGHMMTVPMAHAMGLPADFDPSHVSAGVQGVSLQQAVTEGVEPGAKAARDAAVAAELMAMVNPAVFLGESRGQYDPAWQHAAHGGSAMPAQDGRAMPAQATAGGSAQTVAASDPAGGASAASHAHDRFANPAAAQAAAQAAAAAAAAQHAGAAGTAAAGAGGAVGLYAHDIADLWDVLEDYEGGDKESCDALFEHLIDLC